jgi:NAD(P)-dependent dehydrogenase (short-subunit alcohol dehydrogenase family)
MERLANKVVIVTGGAGGIGRAVGKLFADEGAKVLLVDLEKTALQETTESVASDSISHVVADVTDPESVKHYVEVAEERYGGVDVFINNAGIEGEVNLIVDCPVEVFDQVMAVNVRGVWLGLKYVIPAMEKRGGGSIVIPSSISGVKGAPGLSPYVTSKHAVIGMMRTAAKECARLGIRVNTVNPGPIDTRMMRSLEEQNSPGDAEAVKKLLIDRIPLRRYGQAEDVANLMLFLASDESKHCTGGVYMLDGGETA